MKKLIANITFVFAIILISVNISLGQIQLNEVKAVATNFIKKKNLNNSTAIKVGKLTELIENTVVCAYVAQIEPKGFVIISANKDQFPVIAFSIQNNFSFEISDENTFRQFLIIDMLEQQKILANKAATSKIKEIKEKNNLAWDNYISGNLKTLKTTIQYGPLLNDLWGGVNCIDQDSNAIYVGNYYTPSHYSPGCVATSLSQVLHYFEWPLTGTGSHTNYDVTGSSQSTNYADFANTTYDWANMLPEYKLQVSTTVQQQAMGLLAYQCGTALDMDYENYGSTSHINRSPDALHNYFRYCGHYEVSSWTNFWSRLRENLTNGYPAQLGIQASNGAGHAIVCDGYMVDDSALNYYHLNMGWWGTVNAWYLLQDGFSAGGYSSVTGAVLDILPNPVFEETTLTEREGNFTLNWAVSSKLNWDSFSLEQSFNGGSWTVVDDNITTNSYTITNAVAGEYQFRVRAKVNGAYYYNSYSETTTQIVKDDLVFLSFNGAESFFIYDNSSNDLDVSNSWTIETWINTTSYTSGVFPVILDRRTVFSLYLIDATNGDYAVRFVARNSSGTITASVRSDYSNQYLYKDEWAHIAISHGNNFTRLFINGIAVDSTNDADFNLSSTTNALNVGARYWGAYERYFTGNIDGVSITADQKYAANFEPQRFDNFGVTSASKLLVTMDEGTGTSLADKCEKFNSILLRTSPNQPEWMFESLEKSAETNAKNSTTEQIVNEENLFYPNPANNFIYLKISNDLVVNRITIFDLSGKLILAKNIGKTENLVDVSILHQGLYSISISSSKGVFKSKLAIVK